MMQRRTLLAFLISIILVPISGCIGDEDKAEPTGPVKVTDKGSGIDPKVKIVLEPVSFGATGKVTREKNTRPNTIPIFDGSDVYQFVWSFDNLQPLSSDGNTGEVFYQLWTGTKSGDKVQYVGGSVWSGHNNTANGKTSWSGSNGGVTHYMISIEARQDAIIEFPLVEVPEMTKDEAGTWQNESMDPFAKAYGEVKLGTPKDGKLNMTVQVFDLPEKKNGGYDAFLQTASGPVFLGHLELVPSLGAVGVIAEVEEAQLTDWSVFVTYEPKDPKDEVPSYLTVLRSKFKSS